MRPFLTTVAGNSFASFRHTSRTHDTRISYTPSLSSAVAVVVDSVVEAAVVDAAVVDAVVVVVTYYFLLGNMNRKKKCSLGQY